jgi:hypothetical protein
MHNTVVGLKNQGRSGRLMMHGANSGQQGLEETSIAIRYVMHMHVFLYVLLYTYVYTSTF